MVSIKLNFKLTYIYQMTSIEDYQLYDNNYEQI
jgi:hypothetical protein